MMGQQVETCVAATNPQIRRIDSRTGRCRSVQFRRLDLQRTLAERHGKRAEALFIQFQCPVRRVVDEWMGNGDQQGACALRPAAKSA